MKGKLEKILLVDDDAISNYVTEELLREKKICQTIVTVTDGRQALLYLQQALEDKPADDIQGILVLLDLNMPVMDGFEFMEELEALQLHKQVKVAVLTSSDNHKDISQAKEYSFAAYLQKPLVVEEVGALVQQCFSA